MRRVNCLDWWPAWTRLCTDVMGAHSDHVSTSAPQLQPALRVKPFRPQQVPAKVVTPCFAGQDRYET